MKVFSINEVELNAIAELLNECRDNGGALLRPRQRTFDNAWQAVNAVDSRARTIKVWEITFKNGCKESFASYSIALGYAQQFGLSEPVEVEL